MAFLFGKGNNKGKQNQYSQQGQQHGRQQYQQQQVQKQTEAQIELLKDQIDSLFKIFHDIVNYLKSDEVDDDGLLVYNDSAAATLKIFAVSCMNKDKFVLNVSHAHFTGKKQGMDRADLRIVESWLEYAERALLGKKVKKLQISKVTIDTAHKQMKQYMGTFLNKHVGAEHVTERIVRNADQNREKLKKDHAKIAKQNEAFYQQRQGAVRNPGQNAIYQVHGNPQNIQFASALNHPSSKYYNPKQAAEEKKEQNSGSMDVDNSGSNMVNNNQYMNAYVKKAPKKTVMRDNKKVRIQYPYPCVIKAFLGGGEIGVVYASPNDDLRVRVQESNLERDPVKVSEFEQGFLSSFNSNQGLGYDSILQQQNQAFQ